MKKIALICALAVLALPVTIDASRMNVWVCAARAADKNCTVIVWHPHQGIAAAKSLNACYSKEGCNSFNCKVVECWQTVAGTAKK